MTYLLGLACFILSILAGYAMTQNFFGKKAENLAEHFLLFSLGTGLSFGLLSCTYFLYLMTLSSYSHLAFIAMPLYFSILVFTFHTLKKKNATAIHVKTITANKSSTALRVSFGIVLFITLCTFVVASYRSPYGTWDAIAHWNFLGKMMGFGGKHWTLFFSEHRSVGGGGDYPLLLPGILGFFWKMTGHPTQIVPILISGFYTFSIIALVTSTLCLIKGEKQGLLAGIILMGTRFLISHGDYVQFADIPMTFYITGLLTISVLCDTLYEGKTGLLILMGLLLGFACWTKNDAILMCAGFIISRIVLLGLGKKFKLLFTELLYIGLGGLPVFIVWFIFHQTLAPDGTALASQSANDVQNKLHDGSRYLLIIGAYFSEWGNFKRWPMALPFFAYAIFIFNWKTLSLRSVQTLILTLLLAATGYFFVFVISNYSTLEIHIEQYLDRTILHLFPSLIFLGFLTSYSVPFQADASKNNAEIKKEAIVLKVP